MTINRQTGFAALTTHGEVDELQNAEFGFASEAFNLFSETTPKPKPMKKTAKREDYQLELF